MLTIQDISYTHPDKSLLFSNVHFSVNKHQKVALIGNNGSGKSTLLKIIAKELQPSSGQISAEAKPYYVPQIFGQFDHLTIAQVLQVDGKLNALKEILDGKTSEENFNTLADDWTIEDRCSAALNYWQLINTDLFQQLAALSGGEKMKVFLAGILIHQPELILLDEPSNHLDLESRQLLYDFVQGTKSTLIVVSHDRKLLTLLNQIYELSKNGIKTYGGNYEFYKEQKQIESNALNQDIQNQEKAFRKAREKARETVDRQQKLDTRAAKNVEKAGLPKILANTRKNSAERSTAKITGMHGEKMADVSQNLQELRSALPAIDQMKFGFDDSALHSGKILFSASGVNVSYGGKTLWKDAISFEITSGERIVLKGRNGSGKTTLIKLLISNIAPETGTIQRVNNNAVYIDQDYSLIDNNISVYEQAQDFNSSALQEHEVKIRLNRFLFTRDDWDKSCSTLSGGERMRLLLCCLTINIKSPDIIILDEPTNNLDIQNVEILRAAINEYRGTLIVVSHDQTFLEQIDIQRSIHL